MGLAKLEGRATIASGEVEKMMKEMVGAMETELYLLGKRWIFYVLVAIMFRNTTLKLYTIGINQIYKCSFQYIMMRDIPFEIDTGKKKYLLKWTKLILLGKPQIWGKTTG